LGAFWVSLHIDLLEIALHLDNGRSKNIFCHSCDIRAVYKDESGRIYLAKMIDEEIQIRLVRIEEL